MRLFQDDSGDDSMHNAFEISLTLIKFIFIFEEKEISVFKCLEKMKSN